MPKTVQLPDGRTLVIPDNASPDDLAKLRLKMGSAYADPKTGVGMQQRAQQQAQQRVGEPLRLAGRVQQAMAPSELSGMPGTSRDDLQDLGITATAAGAIADPMATARGLAGGMAGSYGGGRAGKYLAGDTGETVGKFLGGAAGGLMGYGGLPLKGKIAGLPIEFGGGTSASDASTLAQRVAAEQEAARLVRTPEEFSGMEQANRAEESATQLQRPRARLEGMIRSGRGTPPRATNEELSLWDKLRAAGVEPESEAGRDIIMGGPGRRLSRLPQGGDLVDPTTFLKGYK